MPSLPAGGSIRSRTGGECCLHFRWRRVRSPAECGPSRADRAGQRDRSGRQAVSGSPRACRRVQPCGRLLASARASAGPPLRRADCLGRTRDARHWRYRRTSGRQAGTVGEGCDPATSRWRQLAPMPMGRMDFPAVWTGNRLLIWGGSTPPSGLSSDPIANAGQRCRRRRSPNAPHSPRSGRGGQ
jgi:hypothetical protein